MVFIYQLPKLRSLQVTPHISPVGHNHHCPNTLGITKQFYTFFNRIIEARSHFSLKLSRNCPKKLFPVACKLLGQYMYIVVKGDQAQFLTRLHMLQEASNRLL